MAKWLMAAAAGFATLAFAPQAAAQNSVQNGVLVIYGNDRCPTNASGEEIVVCVRRDEGERFRVPKELRELEVTPDNRSWAARLDDTMRVGDTGIGSCSTVGPGGQTGCFGQAAAAAKAERRLRARAETDLPLD